jgi:hypothetical protein
MSNFHRGSFRTVVPAAEFSQSFGFWEVFIFGYTLLVILLLLGLLVDLERFELSTS